MLRALCPLPPLTGSTSTDGSFLDVVHFRRQAAGGVHPPALTLAPVWSIPLQADTQSSADAASCKRSAMANAARLPDWPAEGGLYANASGKSLKMPWQESMVGFPMGSAEDEGAPIGSRA